MKTYKPFPILEPKIKDYFVIKIGDDFIAEYKGIINYIGPGCGTIDTNLIRTDNMLDIKLLFDTYDEAQKFVYALYARHNLLRITNNLQNELSIVPFRKCIWEESDPTRTFDINS